MELARVRYLGTTLTLETLAVFILLPGIAVVGSRMSEQFRMIMSTWVSA
jgi:hypothetical protein